MHPVERDRQQSVQFAKQRKQFGQPIAKFQLVGTKLVDMKLRLESARYIAYHGAYQRSLGRSAVLESALTKLHVSDCWVKTCEDAIQIHGAYGYMTESELERELRDAMGSRLFSGTNEIQRNLVAALIR
jgi:alkylation response protein AidB-like acyl-CoA dehydrogenase